MKTILYFFTLVLLLSGCTIDSAENIRGRDEGIGFIENDSYRFLAHDGLLHIKESTDAGLILRASAAEFSAQLTRKQTTLSSLNVQISNLPSNPTLQIDGVPTQGTPVSGLSHTYSWTLSFTSGDDVAIVAPPLTQQNFQFLAFGDIQNAVDIFGDMVDAVNKETSAEFILMLGDLTSRTKPEEFNRVEEHYARIRVPVYATPGNHDVFKEGAYQQRFGRANYSFTHRGTRFTSVDTSSAKLDPVVWDWSRNWMELGQNTLHVIFTHIPVLEYSGIRSGQWNSRREANKFIATARSYAVDLFLFGHVHSYYSYALAGIPTFISGGCGAIPERLDGVGRHYLRINVDTASNSFKTVKVDVD